MKKYIIMMIFTLNLGVNSSEIEFLELYKNKKGDILNKLIITRKKIKTLQNTPIRNKFIHTNYLIEELEILLAEFININKSIKSLNRDSDDEKH